MSDYPVWITSCEKYYPALKPMAWLMEKYWQPAPKVVVMGFSQPDFELPPNWSFYSVGRQEDYPFKK